MKLSPRTILCLTVLLTYMEMTMGKFKAFKPFAKIVTGGSHLTSFGIFAYSIIDPLTGKEIDLPDEYKDMTQVLLDLDELTLRTLEAVRSAKKIADTSFVLTTLAFVCYTVGFVCTCIDVVITRRRQKKETSTNQANTTVTTVL